MITLEGLTKDFETPAGCFRALQSVELEIGAGEFVALIGRSGSGKSTLLNMMGGIDKPSSGVVRVDGTRISALGESALARWRGRTVGFVFQFFQLLPTLTALENVMLPMDFSGVIAARARPKRARELLQRVGVLAQAGKLPAALSGGEQQRVAIARGLANDAPVILADEPTGNLDSYMSEVIFRLFGELAADGRTVVVATHERQLPACVSRTVELADGVVMEPVRAKGSR